MRTSGDGVCARQSFQGQSMRFRLTMSMTTEYLAPLAGGSLCSDCLLAAKAAVLRQQSKLMPGSACASRHVEQERQTVATATLLPTGGRKIISIACGRVLASARPPQCVLSTLLRSTRRRLVPSNLDSHLLQPRQLFDS